MHFKEGKAWGKKDRTEDSNPYARTGSGPFTLKREGKASMGRGGKRWGARRRNNKKPLEENKGKSME